MYTKESLADWFDYHAATPEKSDKYSRIRDAAVNLANVIVENAPPCADQSAALRKVREASMTANLAISCDGRSGHADPK
jgi:hypothetical protein